MRTLIIADVHERIIQAQSIIDHVKADKIVFTGDFFDSYDLPDRQSSKTAAWVKEKLYDPNVTVLTGNHDAPYMFLGKGFFSSCSGYSAWKKDIINEVLSRKDWKLFQGVTAVNGVLLCHAGLSSTLREHLPIQNKSLIQTRNDCSHAEEIVDTLKGQWDKAQEMGLIGDAHPLFWCGRYRGGYHAVSGITWCDKDEYVPLKGIATVFGHTRNRAGQHVFLRLNNPKNNHTDTYYPEIDTRDYSKLFENGVGIGIDSDLRGYAVIEGDELTVFSIVYNKDLSIESSKPVWKFNVKTLTEIK